MFMIIFAPSIVTKKWNLTLINKEEVRQDCTGHTEQYQVQIDKVQLMHLHLEIELISPQLMPHDITVIGVRIQ